MGGCDHREHLERWLDEISTDEACRQAGKLTDANLSGSAVANSVFDEAVLHGTNLQGLEGWQEIRSITGAKLKDLKNAPDGFIEWALQHGAIQE